VANLLALLAAATDRLPADVAKAMSATAI